MLCLGRRNNHDTRKPVNPQLLAQAIILYLHCTLPHDAYTWCCVADAVNTHESADTDPFTTPVFRKTIHGNSPAKFLLFHYDVKAFCRGRIYPPRYVTLTQMISYVSQLILSFRPSVCRSVPRAAFFFSFFFHDILCCSESKFAL